MVRNKSISLLFIIILILSMVTIFNVEFGFEKVNAVIITVNDDGGADFTAIQDAIDNASAGDTIYIWAGTYNESVIIDKPLTLLGNGTSNTTINGTGIGDAVRVTANFVNISGFTIMGGGSNFYDGGIRLHRIINCTITNNNLIDNRNGIYFSRGSGHLIFNNTCINNSRGLFTFMSSTNYIQNNTFKLNRDYGIYLYYSNSNIILDNNCSQNPLSIYLYSSDFNSIENNLCNSSSTSDIIIARNSNFNKIANNTCNGIAIEYSGSNMVLNNTIGSDGININGNQIQHWNQTVDLNNTVSGKTIIFWYQINSSKVPLNIGQVILFYCENITVENQSFDDLNTAIMLGFSKNIVIRNNTGTNLSSFISLSSSDYNLIENNNYNSTFGGEILLEGNSNSNEISNNTCGSISFESSGNNTILNNSLTTSGIKITGNQLDHWIHNFDLNNTVNFEIIYYMYNVSNTILPIGGGQVILIGCQNITVENQNFSDKGAGIILGFSNFNNIINNTCYNNGEPINLWNSNNNVIEDNICINTSSDALTLINSNLNTITNNVFNSNLFNGIRIQTSNSNTISNNICNFNQNNGIYLSQTDSNTLRYNKCNLNSYNGLELMNSDLNQVSNGTYNSNSNHGIFLSNSEFNTIKDSNNKYNNRDGINISDCNFNTINRCTCIFNDESGINNYLGDFSVIKNNNCSMNNLTGISIFGEYVGYPQIPHGLNNTVEDNICQFNNKSGLNCIFSNKNKIHGNKFSNNEANGINYIGDITTVNWLGVRNVIKDNICNKNKKNGIYFNNGTSNDIENNIINANTEAGLYLYRSMKNNITNNKITNNTNGTIFIFTDYCRIQNNQINFNKNINSYLFNSSANLISENNLSKSTIGLRMYTHSEGNTIFKNLISLNSNTGIIFESDSNINIIYYNNFISNNKQAEEINSPLNIWENYLEEGNYWSDYNGLDNGEQGRDIGDGIGDTQIPHIGLDWYPFINFSGWEYPGIPILNDPGELNFNGEYTLIWNEPRDFLGFTLQESTSETFVTKDIIYNGDLTSHLISNKTDGTYYYRVRAYNDQNPGDWSNTVNITIILPPPSPKNLQIDDYPAGNALNITWDPVIGNIMEYHLFYRISQIGSWSEKAIIIPHPFTTYNHTNLINGETYYYRLKAIDIYNHSSDYSIVVGRKPWDSIAPAKPTGLKIKDTTNDTITLTWNLNSENDIVGYNIYRSVKANTAFWDPPINDDVLVTFNEFTDEGLDEETTYYYMITALDEVPNESRTSEVISGSTLLGPHGPEIKIAQNDFQILEDTIDDTTINLYKWFKDKNKDTLQFNVSGQRHIDVRISQWDGKVTLIPESDWNGVEILVFSARDSNFTIYDNVEVTVASVNDPPKNAHITTPFEGYTINDSTPVFFEGKCDDVDLQYGNDKLTYSWSSNITGLIRNGNSFNKLLVAGKHQITLTVTDSADKKSEAIVNITIEKTPLEKPPEDTTGDDGTTGKDEGGIDLMITGIGLLVLFLLFIILFIYLTKSKKGEKTDPCPECGTMVPKSVKVCPDCGVDITKEGVTVDEEAELDDIQKISDIEGEMDNESEISEVDELFDDLEEESEPKSQVGDIETKTSEELERERKERKAKRKKKQQRKKQRKN